MIHNDASLDQIRAADPAASTWLSANAGSGKTRVLIDRVARLLLNGTEPQKILCLTYTNAAATEMQNRLFDRLGRWAMLPEADLREALDELGIESSIDDRMLAAARRLFARAIETPGGLKIQTIHSFCSALLRRFPLEAGVSPNFTELDEHSVKLLRRETAEEIAAEPDAKAFDALAGLVSGDEFGDVLGDICARPELFQTCLTPAAANRLFDLPEAFDADALMNFAFTGGEARLVSELIPLLRVSGGTDDTLANRLESLDLVRPNLATLKTLENALLFGPRTASPFGAKIGHLPKKGLQQGLAAPLLSELNALMTRVEAARPKRIAYKAACNAAAIHRFASVFLPKYESKKARRGVLDFDDLIRRSSALLSTSATANWVLYRLDGGIDHILVDEAQDTSPEQWKIVERLAEEFTSGEGARDRVRTIFVVGDMKQSIYSFQGADLRAFEIMRDHFRDKHRALSIPYQSAELIYSFRSSSAVLDIVDLTFDERVNRGLGGSPKHRAYRSALPGRVDLWSPVPETQTPEAGVWYDPEIVLPGDHHTIVHAERIASEIRRMIDSGTCIPLKDGSAKVVDEGDIIILVQSRGDLFHAIIRACKSAGLNVAGTDRLRLGGEIAVKDLVALLSFLATPEDDLSLASVLRSPLFGWSEDDLFRLAANRPANSFLWQEMRERAEDFPETVSILADLRDSADFLRPYELVDRILTRHDGRRKLIGRLGSEAEDGIDALLDHTLTYERTGVPSLTGFLAWMETDSAEIKRRIDAGAGALRVMSVHGAKGLEAPIVILPDTEPSAKKNRKNILQIGEFGVWKGASEDIPDRIDLALSAETTRLKEERMRLLYVAMTRAKVWLIVAAAGKLQSDEESWYRLVESAMERAGSVELPANSAGFPAGRRYSTLAWPEAPNTQTDLAGSDAQLQVPAWIAEDAVPPSQPEEPLSPSGLGGAKALPGEAGLDEDAAKRHGTLVHTLLEHLPNHPRENWEKVASLILGGDLISGERESVLSEAISALGSPEMLPLLSPGALSEVSLTARISCLGNRLFFGTIDRLIVEPDRVLAVDFKSNAVVPAAPDAIPDGLLRQMGAYAEMLAEIYPDRQIDTAIFWTKTAQMMLLPRDIVRNALAATTIP